MWMVLAQRLDTPAGAVALEACRTVDRLDRLDRVLAGELFDVRQDDDGGRMILMVDSALVEARQQGQALAKLLGQLGMEVPVAAPVVEVVTPLEAARRRREQAGGKP